MKRCFHSFAISSAHAARRFLTDIFVVFYSIWRLKNKCSDRSNGSLTSLPRLTNQPTSQPTDWHESSQGSYTSNKWEIKLLRYRQYSDNFTKGLLLSQDQTHKIFIIPKIYLFLLSFLWQVMMEFEVKRLVFSSSATVYGQPQYLPVDEKHPTGTETCTVENCVPNRTCP